MRNESRKYSSWLTTSFSGLSDGLIIPFAFMTGASRILPSSQNIVDLLLVIIPVAALLMAIGNYFTMRDQVYEQTSSLSKKSSNIKSFYSNIGFNAELLQQATAEHLQEKLQWEEMSSEQHDPLPHPFLSALTIFIAYIIGGILSLIPYFLNEDPHDALIMSILITIPLLFASGFVKSWLAGAAGWLGGLQLMFFGTLAAGAAFAVARLFSV
jgi:vacuolar iron transporter family protein